MTNDFRNPLTIVHIDPNPDVSVSIINYHTYSTLLAQTQTYKCNAFYQHLAVSKSTLIPNKGINMFLIVFSSWRLKIPIIAFSFNIQLFSLLFVATWLISTHTPIQLQWICLFNFHFIYSLRFIVLSYPCCYFFPANYVLHP